MSGHTDDCIFKTTGYCDCGWWNEIGAYVPEDKDALIERLQKELGEARGIISDYRSANLDITKSLGVSHAQFDAVCAANATIRAKTIEECANVAEEHGAIVSNDDIGKACSRNIAKAIRSMDGGGK